MFYSSTAGMRNLGGSIWRLATLLSIPIGFLFLQPLDYENWSTILCFHSTVLFLFLSFPPLLTFWITSHLFLPWRCCRSTAVQKLWCFFSLPPVPSFISSPFSCSLFSHFKELQLHEHGRLIYGFLAACPPSPHSSLPRFTTFLFTLSLILHCIPHPSACMIFGCCSVKTAAFVESVCHIFLLCVIQGC